MYEHDCYIAKEIMSDIKMYEAEDMGEKIVDRYGHYGTLFDIKETKIFNDVCKFRIKLSKDCRLCDLVKDADNVRRGAKLRYLRIVEDDVSIWIIASYNNVRSKISILEALESDWLEKTINEMNVIHPIGIDEMGKPVAADLTLHPQLLIAGTTRSGKSTAVIVLLICLICKYFPDDINIILSDPSGDLSLFNGLPHLSCPVITDFEQFYMALLQLHAEMMRRNKLKHTDEFKQLPYIIFIADEFITMISGNESKKKHARSIFQEILRMGRHAKIHVVAVAFNPTSRNLNNLDTADLPARMVFKVAKLSNSVAVIGHGGAEKLSGNGDMLFQSSESGELQRIQGFNIPLEKELIKFIGGARDFWANQHYTCQHHFYISLENCDLPIELPSKKTETSTKQLADAIVWALGKPTVSANEMMQEFGIGWNKAKKIMLQLEALGVIHSLESKQSRKVLLQSIDELSDMLINILMVNGYSEDDIADLFCHREANMSEIIF